MDIKWFIKRFEELSINELYSLLQLRARVFAVEQDCVYQDLDDKDQPAIHVMGYNNEQLVAYSRLLPPGVSYEDMSIGRVVSDTSVRRYGIGKELMNVSIRACYEHFGEAPIRISAQLYLKAFYEAYSFVAVTEPYIEDNILHIEMVRN